jgi:hypothetical protein
MRRGVEGLDFAEFHLDKLSQLLQFNCNECNFFCDEYPNLPGGSRFYDYQSRREIVLSRKEYSGRMPTKGCVAGRERLADGAFGIDRC